jgi:hypothetical protein
MNWIKTEHGFRSDTHYVGQSPKRWWSVWAGSLETGYTQIGAGFRTADDAKASVTQVVAV